MINLYFKFWDQRTRKWHKVQDSSSDNVDKWDASESINQRLAFSGQDSGEQRSTVGTDSRILWKSWVTLFLYYLPPPLRCASTQLQYDERWMRRRSSRGICMFHVCFTLYILKTFFTHFRTSSRPPNQAATNDEWDADRLEEYVCFMYVSLYVFFRSF